MLQLLQKPNKSWPIFSFKKSITYIIISEWVTSSVVEHFLDTEGVVSSILTLPTNT